MPAPTPKPNTLEVIIITNYAESKQLAVTRKTNSLIRRDSTVNADAIIKAAYQMVVDYLAQLNSIAEPNGRHPVEGAYEAYHAGVHADVLDFLRSGDEDGCFESPVTDNIGQAHRSYFSVERIALHNS